MENKTFDARGMACPLPVVNAKKESEEMTNGDRKSTRLNSSHSV